MNDLSKISLDLEVSPDIFPIEIVFHEEDRVFNTPVVYMPYIPTKSDKKFPQWMIDEAFSHYDEMKNQKTERSDVTYSNGDSEENFIEKETPELKCIRRGRLVVRVYGPPDKAYCSRETKLQMKVMQEIYEKRNWISARLNLFYKQGNRLLRKIITFHGNTGDYHLKEGVTDQPSTDEEDVKTSYEALVDEALSGENICLNIADQFLDKQLEDKESFTNPCKNKERKTHKKFREVLTFAGDLAKKIKYWYIEDPSKIKILKTSVFLDTKGNTLSSSEKPTNKTKDKTGVVFIAKKNCYGSILIEYDVDYTEFVILYDLEKPKRKFRIITGTIEKVGYLTASGNNIAAQGDKLTGNDVDIDDTRDEYDDRLQKEITVNLTLTAKVEFLPYTPQPITFFVTDKINIVTATFTPEVEFNDSVLTELPKMAIYERRKRESYVDNIEEVIFIDAMGNVTTENLEQRDNI